MRFKELVKVDSKGRITIPLAIREAFGIHEGMNVLLIADMDERKIFISPIPNRAKLMEINIRVEDRPGVVAEVSKTLADQGVDIVAIKCVVIKRGELGECYIVVDLSKSLITDAVELKKLLLKLEPVREVDINEIVG